MVALSTIEQPVQPPPLIAELVNRGITDSTAIDLVKRHQAEAIEHQVDVFDWLVSKKDKRVSKSPAGYLVKAIETNYKEPAGFISRADRQAREDAARQAERKAAALRRQEHEQQAREQAERKAINVYWESLTPEEQAEIDAAAQAQADPAVLVMETGALKSFGQTLRRHDYIRQLLPTLEPVAAEA